VPNTLPVLLFALLLPVTHVALPAPPDAQAMTLPLHGNDFSITRYPASGRHLIIWLSPGLGSTGRPVELSRALAKNGVESWHVDLAEDLFLPKTVTTLRELDGRYVAALIEAAHEATGKQITLLSRSYAAVPLLRGVRRWQRAQQQSRSDAAYLTGAILVSPELYSSIPPLGLEPRYLPVVSATNIPLVIYQAGARGNRWQLDTVLAKLATGGAQVYCRVMPGVTALFYGDDESVATRQTLQQLPAELPAILSLLERTATPLQAPDIDSEDAVAGRGLDITLQPFRGNPGPLPLDLLDEDDNRFMRESYTGKVTVINFWATWCPPCIEEIPSLNNLRKVMRDKPFELISVNYAESRERVNAFLERVNVDFPVLLDTDGRVSAAWNVLAYPSTFVIGPDGKIRYGVNAAIYWDSPEVLEKINRLLP
jgi:thiol-disulfide isomerase/thioredoxin